MKSGSQKKKCEGNMGPADGSDKKAAKEPETVSIRVVGEKKRVDQKANNTKKHKKIPDMSKHSPHKKEPETAPQGKLPDANKARCHLEKGHPGRKTSSEKRGELWKKKKLRVGRPQ